VDLLLNLNFSLGSLLLLILFENNINSNLVNLLNLKPFFSKAKLFENFFKKNKSNQKYFQSLLLNLIHLLFLLKQIYVSIFTSTFLDPPLKYHLIEGNLSICNIHCLIIYRWIQMRQYNFPNMSCFQLTQ